MAKPPSKRRGINLDPRADTAAPLDRMAFQTADFPATTATSPPAGTAPEAMPEVLAQLRQMSADLDNRWQHQEKQLRQQRQQLEEQREQIAQQTRQLHSLAQARRSTARLGVLLSLLLGCGTFNDVNMHGQFLGWLVEPIPIQERQKFAHMGIDFDPARIPQLHIGDMKCG